MLVASVNKLLFFLMQYDLILTVVVLKKGKTMYQNLQYHSLPFPKRLWLLPSEMRSLVCCCILIPSPFMTANNDHKL